jgi:hypothetical protein
MMARSLVGGGYDPPVSDVNEVVKHRLAAARQIGGWAHQNLGRLVAFPYIPGRGIFQRTAKAALSRYQAETASP